MLAKTKTIFKAGLAAAVLATSVAAFPTVSQAAEPGALPSGSYQVADNWGHGGGGDWRWRHRGYGGWDHHRGYGYGYPGYGYGYGYGYDSGWGDAAAAGIIGLAAGAVIANSANRSYAYDDYDAYCSERYRTYNPRTRTYIGNDRQPHVCVMR